MFLPALSPASVLAAVFPLLLVLGLMIGRRWGGSQAGPAGWLAAAGIAVGFFGAPGPLLLVAAGRALLLALYVLYVIWAALLFYHLVNEAGGFKVIAGALSRLAGDVPAQALLLAWVFGSFLQGASGFGVPAAVVGPLLLGLGLSPDRAAVVALLGHGWAVTFGSLGSSFFALIAASGLEGKALAGPAALQLGLACLLCGAAVLWLSGGAAAFRRRWREWLLVGGLMAGVQYALATAGLWSLAALGAALAGLATLLVWLRQAGRGASDLADNSSSRPPGRTALVTALVPYGLLTVVVLVGQLVLAEPLSALTLEAGFPAVETAFGWRTPAGRGQPISVLGHPGALLLYSSLLSYLWLRARPGAEQGFSAAAAVRKTLRASIKPTLGIITLLAMALTMQLAGMTQLLAFSLSQAAGPLFPVVSPFLGALGAVMTGSNTNSNVVFGALQLQTAGALGLPASLILATQTAGAAMGSIFAPAKVILAASTIEGAEEGRVLRLALVYGLLITAALALITWLGWRLGFGS
ncbi:MAG: L-lactate permease [Candidatus Promineifilaceae bacterium]